MYEPWITPVMRAFAAYRDGFLPVAGGIVNQTQGFQRVLPIMVAAASAHEERRAQDRLKARE